jgi:hypothetical protein
MRDFFDPPVELQNVVLVDARTLRQAEKLIIGCEGCSPDDADLPFDNVLDRVTDNDPASPTTFSRKPWRSVRTAGGRLMRRRSSKLTELGNLALLDGSAG